MKLVLQIAGGVLLAIVALSFLLSLGTPEKAEQWGMKHGVIILIGIVLATVAYESIKNRRR
jgi:Na+/melibiose symporter-like transporter